MSGTSAAARAAAARAVDAVRREGRSLDEALPAASASLPDGARPLTAALAYGALRHFRQLDALIERLLERPLPRRDAVVHALLMIALFERWQLGTPAHAAVAEAVNAVPRLGRPRLKGLVNAVLRRFGRERDALLAALPDAPAVRHSYPDWFVDRVRRDWPDVADAVLAGGNARAPMWLRVNLARTSREDYRARLEAAGLHAVAADSSASALRLAAPVAVDALPGFAEGDVSVQDLAAQHVAPDACAAPGGKAGHLLETAAGALDLVAIDSDPERLRRVRETLRRLGFDAAVAAGDAGEPDGWWDGVPFDRILVDAPCTGSGVVRRHPDIKLLRRDADVGALANRQLGLLRGLWPTLRPGGCLVYATCSIFRDENHAVVSAFCDDQPDARPDNELRGGNIHGLMRVEPLGHQLLPGDGDGDGFFFCVLCKDGG